MLYGVDVRGSRYLRRPEVLRAAHFAAAAHEGQVLAFLALKFEVEHTSSLAHNVYTLPFMILLLLVHRDVVLCLQTRLTKEPYIVHCVETAAIVECLHASSKALDEIDERYLLSTCASSNVALGLNMSSLELYISHTTACTTGDLSALAGAG